MSIRITAALAILVSAAIATPALADRKPTADELTKIETALKKEGFTKWEEIEYEEDDREIEVDDAVDANGKVFDLELDPKTLAITGKREEGAAK